MSNELRPTERTVHESPQKHEAIIDEWHREVLRKIQNSTVPGRFSYIASGNSIVIGLELGNEIKIIEVTNGYASQSYYKITKAIDSTNQ